MSFIGRILWRIRGVRIGRGTVLRRNVELRRGTRIGRDCYIDSQVISSGDVTVGDRVTLRYGVILARGCTIGDDAYLAPRVMFNNLDHTRRAIGGATIGPNCFVGTHAVIGAGLTVVSGTTIGACSLLTRDIQQPGIYVGVPARRIK